MRIKLINKCIYLSIIAPAGVSPRRRNPEYLQLKYTVSMPEEIQICLNTGREESVGNDDISIVCARKYEMVRMTRRDRLGRFCDIYCAVVLRYFFASRVISDILWSRF